MEQEKDFVEIVKFYNEKTGQRLQVTNADNEKIINKGLKIFNKEELKSEIEKVLSSGNLSLNDCITEILLNRATERTEEKAEAIKELSILEKAVVDMVAKTQIDQIEGKILKELRHTADEFIKENYGTIQRKVELQLDDKKVDMGTEVLHSCFDKVLKFVKADEPVFLTGAAGCGKNVLCKQIAKALDLDFHFTNAVTQEYKITGFTDAMGVYHETEFYKAFKNGGIFMLDEMDASIPEVLVILNSAIANKYFDFPAPIGYTEAHPNFRVIAAGNTFGLGADIEYVGRNQLDMASLDRFAMVRVDYDRNIELSLTGNDFELVDFAHLFREACNKAGVKCLCSYRALNRIAKLKDTLGIKDTLKDCLLKSLQKDDLQMIIKACSFSNFYMEQIKEIMEEM